MRRIVRPALFLILVAALVQIGFLLSGLEPNKQEGLAAITGLLAVVTAIISAFPALNVIELQEDASQPRPSPYFDLTSRYDMLQLRVKNIGPSAAYDIRIKWLNCPRNYKDEEIKILDEISVLLPDHSVSTLVGTSHEFVKKYLSLRFEGEIEFKDAKKKRFREKFVCTTQEHGKRLIHDEELPKTLYELQKVPERLEQIATALSELAKKNSSEAV
jgi:hypothetical protein